MIAKVHDETGKIVSALETREKLSADGLEPIRSSPEEFAALIRRDVDKWSKIVKATGARAD